MKKKLVIVVNHNENGTVCSLSGEFSALSLVSEEFAFELDHSQSGFQSVDFPTNIEQNFISASSLNRVSYTRIRYNISYIIIQYILNVFLFHIIIQLTNNP